MAMITNCFEQAQLSLAAYALNLQRGMFGGSEGSPYHTALIGAGMSKTQAANFANTYAVVDQFTDPATGLSATVFINTQTNSINLAIRGTEGFFNLDALADAELLFGGIARNQAISLYNYLQRLITTEGQLAPQVKDMAPDYDIDPITGEVTVNDQGGIRASTSTAGLGYLAGISDVTVTGHSLGGHLAAAISRLLLALTGDTYTYNAPGFHLSAADAFLDQFPGDAGAFPATITNLVANAGANIISSVGDLPGTAGRIFIEDQGIGIPGNHGIVPLTDSLAVYDLFATIAPTVSVSTVTDILKASASTDSKSLENALDALRTLLVQNYEDGSANGLAAATAPDNREDFYTNLINLQTTIKDLPGYDPNAEALEGFSLQSLAGYDGASLAEAAQDDLATRYAVYKLNPFAVSGPGLYEVINTDHALDRYNPATRTGALSDEYLTDRGEFLGAKISSANQNFEYQDKPWAPYGGAALGPARYFKDNESGYAVFAGLEAYRHPLKRAQDNGNKNTLREAA